MVSKKSPELVYLVNAGNQASLSSISNDGGFPALGVLALGTWLKHRIPDLEVICRDGQVMSQDDILAEIDEMRPDLVGVSVLATNYQNALEIAERAHEVGATTVFGNDQAAQLAPKILAARPYVDYVVGSEYGEYTLEKLIEAHRASPGAPKLDRLPELAYRGPHGVTGFRWDRDKRLVSIVNSPLFTGSRKNALDVYPLVDRSLYPQQHWDAFLENHLRKFSFLYEDGEVTGVTTINRARGCSRAKDPCGFCDMSLDISFSSPGRWWDETRYAHEQTGANIFYEVCDSLSSFPAFLKELIAAKPSDLGFDPKFFVYAQALDLTRRPEIVDYFKELGVYRVNLGLESGSNRTLKEMKGGHDSVVRNYAALRMLNKAGIHTYVSFVLGSPEEGLDSVRDTESFTYQIMRERLVSDIEVQPMLPLENSRYGALMRAHGMPYDRRAPDWPADIDGVSERFINRFATRLPGPDRYRHVLSTMHRILDEADRLGIPHGSGVTRRRR